MPQTLNQFTEKIDELLDTVRSSMRIRAERLFRSGAVDPETYDDNYVLPKTILIACLLDEAGLWEPLTRGRRFKLDLANLRRF